jgi:cytochrome oxidase Cu insertion factor (SCO1/SenC/PrrC family)
MTSRRLGVLVGVVVVALGVALATRGVDGGDPAVTIGDHAPDFTLPSSDGGVRHLSDLHGKKPLVLVFFRGVW